MRIGASSLVFKRFGSAARNRSHHALGFAPPARPCRIPSGGCQHAHEVYTSVGVRTRAHERRGRLECSGRRPHSTRCDASGEENAKARMGSGFKLERKLDR
jgi:hypothetical protein